MGIIKRTCIFIKAKVLSFTSKGTYDYMYVHRIQELISRGLKIGKNVTIESGAIIDEGYPYLISIGDNCTIANHVKLIAHDDTLYKFTDGYARIGKIDIKENCLIGANCVILPGITIGPNVLVAAGSVVNKDIPPNSCVAGVPARFYAKFDEFLEKNKQDIRDFQVFEYSKIRSYGKINEETIKQVREATKDHICFVKGKKGSRYDYQTWT
ncbi:MAG: hypothetical protein JW855_01525 [Gammaproteobacteria bacterium]|nr:hypothetical protein [Gammaproteobacteria bacterium]